jgi:hypothetical protein
VPDDRASVYATHYAAVKGSPRTIGIYETRSYRFTKPDIERDTSDHVKGMPRPDRRKRDDSQAKTMRLDSAGNVATIRNDSHRFPERFEMREEINERVFSSSKQSRVIRNGQKKSSQEVAP